MLPGGRHSSRTPAYSTRQPLIDMPASRKRRPAGCLVATPSRTEIEVFMVRGNDSVPETFHEHPQPLQPDPAPSWRAANTT